MNLLLVNIEHFIKLQKESKLPKSTWFETQQIDLYMRAGPYGIHSKGVRNCIVIANVQVDYSCRRQGIFTSLVNKIFQLAQYHEFEYIVIEGAMTEAMHYWCSKNYFILDRFNNYISKVKSKDTKYITVSKGAAGYYAVLIEDDEPVVTGCDYYPHFSLAAEEAQEWAKAENVPFKND